ALDDDVVVVAPGGGECGGQLGPRLDADGHALALVAVARLDHHRQPDLARERPGVVHVGAAATGGDRYARRGEQLLREFLVLRDGLRDRAAAIRLGRLDPSLAAAPAELHQAAVGQATVGDAARHRRGDDRTGARAEAQVLVEIAQSRECAGQVEGRVLAGRRAQAHGTVHRLAPDGLLGVLDDDVEDAGLPGRDRARERYRAAGLRLQPERRELQQLRHAQVALVGIGAQGPDAGEALADPGFDPGQRAQRGFRRFASDG